MILAVASGKGGTGKTTVAVSLALALAERGPVTLLDCDVEAPNARLLLPELAITAEPVTAPAPMVDENLCNACGECARFCQYKAIVSLKTKPLVFPEMCHGCGGCGLVCPQQAIKDRRREIGMIERGRLDKLEFHAGRLTVGEAMSPPVIRAVKKAARADGGPTIIDSPPGAACPAVTTLRGVDFVLLVTEPTPFGLHDLSLLVEAIRELQLPVGVVVNRADGDRRVHEYCAAQGLPLLGEIPFDRRIAEAYSRGRPALSVYPDLSASFLAWHEAGRTLRKTA